MLEEEATFVMEFLKAEMGLCEIRVLDEIVPVFADALESQQ